MNYKIEQRKISVSEYQLLRKTTGWDMLEDSVVEIALDNDLFSVCVLDGDSPVGIGRVIGDCAIYFYIQDVIVVPEYRGKGIGAIIMERIENFLNGNANHNSFVGLMAADGVKEFYYKFGYSERQATKPGMYKMIKR